MVALRPPKPPAYPRHQSEEDRSAPPHSTTKHTSHSTSMTASHHGIQPPSVHETATPSSATADQVPAQNFQPTTPISPIVVNPSASTTPLDSDSPFLGSNTPTPAQPTVMSSAIAGCIAAVGGVILLLALVFAVLLCKRHRRQRAARIQQWRISPFPPTSFARPETACEIWDTRPPSRWTTAAERCTSPPVAWTHDRCTSPEMEYIQSPMETPTSSTFLLPQAPRRGVSPPRCDSELSYPESILEAFPSPPPSASVRVQRARVVPIVDVTARERLCRAIGFESAVTVLHGQEHVPRHTSP